VSPLLFKRLSDENLGSRLASGEAAAFDELYRRYAHRLAAYGSHLLGDAASGEDVAQAAMLKAYGALRNGRLPDRMKPWLYRIAHNAAIDLVARRRELSTETLPEQSAREREPFAGALIEALATLPDRQRRVYVLREVHGLRIDETGAELGLTTAQVEQSLFAARNRLAEQLVFGDRLNCVTVQRLAEGPLDASERRALKTHLRSCHQCRQTMGLRGRALSIFPSGAGLEWLRGLGAGLIGGGAPVAAKVGAVVATATIVGGGTVAVEKTAQQHAHRATFTAVPTPSVITRAARRGPLAVEAVQVASVAGAPVRRAHEASSGGETRSHDSVTKEHESQQIAEHGDRSSSGDDASRSEREHASTTVKQDESEHTASREHSGEGSEPQLTETHSTETQPTETQPTETQPTETQPTETQPVEPQDPEHTSTTGSPATTTTSTDVAVPPSSLTVVSVPGD
jgi:RNA polymerase sigma factor (sigma-70 family)